jgi:hypothetical protein
MDWVLEAAKEIAAVAHDRYWSDGNPGISDEDVAAIIRKHCPFKPDTAYVELWPPDDKK